MDEGGTHVTRQLHRDTRLLRKATQTTLMGHAARFLHPVLLVLVTHAYSTEEWGLYVIGYAAMQVLAKVAMQGLQRAFPYWIPRANLTGDSPGIAAGLLRVAIAAMLLTSCAIVLAPSVADLRSVSGAGEVWRVMAFGLPALAVAEILTQITVACGTVNVQVWLRDCLIPMTIVGLALGLHALGLADLGLAWAFVAATWLGAVAIAIATLRVLRDHGVQLHPSWRLPTELRRYAQPLWPAELLIELQYRLDTLALALFVEPGLVGVYGIAKQFGNTVRSLRGALAPMLTALFSDAAHQAHRARLASTYTYATTIAVLTQLPVVVLFVVYGRPILALFGSQYVEGYGAVVVLSVGWLAYSWLGSSEQIIGGFGRSHWLFALTALGVAVQWGLLLVLCPMLGLEGAALAVALTFVIVGGLQLYLTFRLNENSLPLTSAIREPAVTALISTSAGGLSFLLVAGSGPAWLPGAVALLTFSLAYAPLAWRALRTHPTKGRFAGVRY